MKRLPTLAKNVHVKGVRVLVRVDFNVPAENGAIADTFRIKKTLPLVHELVKRGARITLLSHLTERKRHRSFEPLLQGLIRACRAHITLARSMKDVCHLQGSARSKEIILLENLRAFPGEEKNSKAFARELASLGDIYINEDFSQSHRPYASIVTLPKLLPSYVGPLFQEEVRRLSEACKPPHPFVLIVGGLKFKTKVGVLKKFLSRADTVFVGGAIANTFLLAGGHSVGRSPVEKSELARVRKDFLWKDNLMLPLDVRVERHAVRSVEEVCTDDTLYDAGPATTRALGEVAARARMILWNGPLGYVEGGYEEGTKELLRALARSRAKVIIGGGDTMAVIHRHKLEKKFYHLSTGGGAMLEFLSSGTLPGIEALEAQA